MYIINRGSNMKAHVLLNLSNELGKINKIPGLLSILSFFRNKFNIFNIRIFFGVKKLGFCH